MSTKLGFKEPKNLLLFTTDQECLSAEYTTTKTKVDKKTTKTSFRAHWALTGIRHGYPHYLGALETEVEAETKEEAIARIEYLSNYVATIITEAHDKNGKHIFAEKQGREIVAAAHAKFHTTQMHGLEVNEMARQVHRLVEEFGVKNIKKVVDEIVDLKTLEKINELIIKSREAQEEEILEGEIIED